MKITKEPIKHVAPSNTSFIYLITSSIYLRMVWKRLIFAKNVRFSAKTFVFLAENSTKFLEYIILGESEMSKEWGITFQITTYSS